MDQLEIISPTGEIKFVELEASSLTNIGYHPENDLVLTGPGVAAFQAMLDHRQKPYQLVVLSDEGRVRCNGRTLAPYEARRLQNLDSLEVGRYKLILFESESVTNRSETLAPPHPPAAIPPTIETSLEASPPPSRLILSSTTPLPAQPAEIAPPSSRPGKPGQPDIPPHRETSWAALTSDESLRQPAPATEAGGYYAHRPLDRTDEVIIAELSEADWTLEVDQVAMYQLTIVNGGPLVAAFMVTVDGLDPNWVDISQPHVNLNEGERAVISISVSPPRLPTSVAGAHHFAVFVASPNHPGRVSQRGATLNIKPYFEFAVSELTPRRQTIRWRRHLGQASLSITNRGNSATFYRLEGSDDERTCNFEFDVPGEAVPLARQAEVRLNPEEGVSIPIRITPFSRRLIGFRKRTYTYTITTSTLNEQQSQRSMLAEVASAPLIGPWLILLAALILTIILLIIARPRINTFMFADGGQEAVISNGTPVAIRWGASFFTTDIRIDPPIDGLEQPIPARGTVQAYPTAVTAYALTGNNLISRFAPALFPAPVKSIEVQVTRIPPQVTFEAQPSQIVGEGEVALRWAVGLADKIELYRQVGPNGVLELVGDFSGQPANMLVVTPEPDQANTSFVLVASNRYAATATPVSRLITLVTPTPTSPPTPAILFFNGNPTTVNEGQDSTLSWQVADSQQVTLQDPDGIPSIQPPTGNLLVRPQKSGNYTLIPGNGAQPQSIYIQVVAATATPTPTPEPDAPVITIFAADKTELVQGKADSGENEKQVELQWVVTGQVTNVELNGGPDIGVFANLNAEGKLPVTISKNTVFVLTAFNQDKTASQSLQVEVLEATPTPEPPPTPVPPPPPAEIEEFVISAPVPPVEIVGSFQYRIPNGTNVIFKWSTKNAAKVTFVPDGGSSQEASPAGQRAEAVTLPVAGLSRTYLLIAENEDGVRTTASIEVSIIDPPTPNAPRSVIGVETVNDKNEIEWQWDSDPNKAAIVGFRLYRAKVPGGSFQQIADEDDLPPGQTKYNDPINPTCGYNYYVVAVYKDVLGNTKETAASSNSWLSTPCP